MLNRREFLLGVGSGAGLVGLAPLLGCMRQSGTAPLLVMLDENWATGICQLCPSGCGVRVRRINGHPVTLAGNPLHPVNRGGLCARGAAALQLYYDPDRIAGPMRRDPGVVGGWAATTWKEAMAAVADRVTRATAAGPGRIAVIRGGEQDVASELLARLASSAGSPWVVDVQTPAEQGMDVVLRRMHGMGGHLVHDLAGADFVLSLDSGLLEASPRSMSIHRGFADMRSAGGRFVHAGPCLGVTGSKADTWLPIRPGTAGVLAMGLAHMIIKEGYARAAFLRDHVAGFDDWTDESGRWHEGIRTWILHGFSPQRVADVTGLDSADVIRVARGLGAARRPVAIGPVNGAGTDPTADLIAAHTLNAVLGAVDAPGGVLVASRPPVERLGGAPAAQPRRVEDLAEWVLASREPPIDVCFVHDADPVFSSPDGQRVADALRRIPMVVSTSPVLTDTVAAADVVLPDALWIERRSDWMAIDGGGHPVVSMSPPAAAARADSRSAATVVLQVAHAVGGEVAARLPWKSHDEILDQRVTQLFESGAGDVFASTHRSVWTELLERSGWRASSYQTLADLRRGIEERGGWWDPVYHHGEWRRVVARADRRIDLGPVRGAVAWEHAGTHPAGEEEGLLLYVSSDLVLDTRVGGSLPYLQDLGSPLYETGWVTGAGVNPETAERLHLAHGDRVRVASARDEITARVYVSAGIRPDVVVVHAGGGREHGGRYAAGLASNPLRLVVLERSDGGSALPSPTTVTLETVVPESAV